MKTTPHGISGQAEPWVRGSDLLPLLTRAISRHGIEHPELYDTPNDKRAGYSSVTQDISRLTGEPVNTVQKVVRALLDGKRKYTVLRKADAICIACGTTLLAEQIPVFFQSLNSAREAVEAFEWVKDVKFKRQDKQKLIRELISISTNAKAGRYAPASAIAVEIMGGDSCPIDPQLSYRIVGPAKDPRRSRSATTTGSRSSRRQATPATA